MEPRALANEEKSGGHSLIKLTIITFKPSILRGFVIFGE
jgi:hypothetical protein